MELQPDLVIGWVTGNPPEQLEAIKDLGVLAIVIGSSPQRIGGRASLVGGFKGFPLLRIKLLRHPVHQRMVRPGVAAAGQAMVDDIAGKVTGQGSAGEHIRLPESPLGRQQRNGLHMGFDVNIVPLRQELIQALSLIHI